MNISQELIRHWANLVDPLNEDLHARSLTPQMHGTIHNRTEKQPRYYMVVNPRPGLVTRRMDILEPTNARFICRKEPNDIALGDIWGVGSNIDKCFSFAFRTIKPEVLLEYAKKATNKWGAQFRITIYCDGFQYGSQSRKGNFFTRMALQDSWNPKLKVWEISNDPNRPHIGDSDFHDENANTQVLNGTEKQIALGRR